MSGAVLSLIVLVVPGWYREPDRDKTETSDRAANEYRHETLKKQELAGAGSLPAERAGFEPAVRFYPHAALAKRCFRPLSHLSLPRQF